MTEAATTESARHRKAAAAVETAVDDSLAERPLAAEPPPSGKPPLSHAETRNVIVGLMLAIFLGALDQTIVAVALPGMAQQLHGFSLIAWVVSGYLVASTVVTPIYGKLGDLFGRRTLLSTAIVLFLVASIACALAQTMPQLVAARVFQGIGGGGLISIAQTIIADVVPLRERGRYQGYISGVFAVASVSGPVVGGLLTHYLSWRWIFWINLPLGIAAFLVSRRALAHLPVPGVRRRIDYVGAALLVVGLTALLLPISRIGQGVPILEAVNVALFAAAVVVLALCVVHERRTAEPIVPLDLLAIPTVALCFGILFIAFFQLVAVASLSPLRFQMVAGVAADDAAWRLLPLTFMIPTGAFLAGRVMLATGRHRPLQLAGTAALPVALLALAFTSPREALLTALLMIVLGVALGITLPSSLVAVQNAVPREKLGVATAGTAFFRSMGGAIGVAVLSAVLFAAMGAAIPRGPVGEGATRVEASDPALADRSFRLVFLIAALTSTLAFALARRVPDHRLGDRPGDRA